MDQPFNLFTVFWQNLLSIVYPPLCLGCHHRHSPGSGLPLCSSCQKKLARVSSKKILQQLSRLPEASLTVKDAHALWLFKQDNPLQEVLHMLKYSNRPHLGVQLGRQLGKHLKSSLKTQPDLLVPVPLFKTRRLERGYNQSEYLAKGVGAVLDLPTAGSVIERSRATRSQTHLNRQQRWENVSGAFRLRKPLAVKHKHLLLIDDVLTTGSTFASAASTLHQTSIDSLQIAALAVADPK